MVNLAAAALRQKLAAIDAESAVLHAQLSRLAAARRDVVAELRHVTFPILDLPVEIASEIFLQTAPDAIDLHKHPRAIQQFVLTRVCRRWRAIAIDLQALWANVVSPGILSFASQYRLELCSARAGQDAADISIEIDYSEAREASALPLLGNGQMLSHCSSLKTYVPEDPSVLNCFTGKLPRLRKLVLWNPHQQPQEIAAFEETPLLREVELVDIDSSRVSLPWMQLTKLALYLNWAQAEACLDVLRLTLNLETLYLRMPHYPFIQPPVVKLSLRKLRKLTLEYSDVNESASLAFINVLRVPVLVDLTTDLLGTDTTVAIATMLSESHCRESLRRLVLKTNESYVASYGELFSNVSQLDELTITGLGWEQLTGLFSILRCVQTNICALTLETAISRIPYEHIAEFVGPRSSEGSATLRRFELRVPDENLDTGPVVDRERVRRALESLKEVAEQRSGTKIRIIPLVDGHRIDSDVIVPPICVLE
ncbi:hypothetical protein MKEN_00473900 [Mycena kentingensis (nom. inval.)]|nr:hypothetical protein MKEN_00473900 [Mycena kentingensis (nom. inval.)]